jgi:mannose-6-phosphate isomerase-like protein (cupin superfamily)
MATATVGPPDVVNPRSGERIWFSGDAAELRIVGRIPAGCAGPPPHRHLRSEERFTVVSGRIRYYLAGRAVELGPGESILVPRRAAHRFENPFSEEAEIDNHVRPGVEHEVLLRLLAGALSRPRPRLLEMVVALNDGDSVPAGVPVPLARLAIGALRLVSELTGTARRFRAAHLPDRLRS